MSDINSSIESMFTPYIHHGGIEAEVFYEFSNTSLINKIIPQIERKTEELLDHQRQNIYEHLNYMLKELQTRIWHSVEEVDQFFIDNLQKYKGKTAYEKFQESTSSSSR
jgi:capsule polysaccharide modification protein KpsS